jgi:hypothetical protein
MPMPMSPAAIVAGLTELYNKLLFEVRSSHLIMTIDSKLGDDYYNPIYIDVLQGKLPQHDQTYVLLLSYILSTFRNTETDVVLQLHNVFMQGKDIVGQGRDDLKSRMVPISESDMRSVLVRRLSQYDRLTRIGDEVTIKVREWMFGKLKSDTLFTVRELCHLCGF